MSLRIGLGMDLQVTFCYILTGFFCKIEKVLICVFAVAGLDVKSEAAVAAVPRTLAGKPCQPSTGLGAPLFCMAGEDCVAGQVQPEGGGGDVAVVHTLQPYMFPPSSSWLLLRQLFQCVCRLWGHGASAVSI